MTKEDLKSTIADYKELINLFKENEAELKGEEAFEALRQEIKTIKAVLDEKIANLGIAKEQQPPIAATTAVGQPMQLERVMADEPPLWEKQLKQCKLPENLKMQIRAILNESDASPEIAADIIFGADGYYNNNILKKKEDEKHREAAKAALVKSLSDKQAAWTASDAHQLFKSYYFEGVIFEKVELSASDYTKETHPNGVSTVLVPVPIEAIIKKIPHLENFKGNFAIKIVFKDSASTKKEWEDWAGAHGSSWMSSTMNLSGKTSTSLYDLDAIKGSFSPVAVNARISGPKMQGDVNLKDFGEASFGLSLCTVSINGELKGMEILSMLGGTPPKGIANISLSFNLSYSVAIGFDETDKKLLRKEAEQFDKKVDLQKKKLDTVKKQYDLENNIKKLEKSGNPDKKQLSKLKQHKEKLVKQLEKFDKMTSVIDNNIEKLEKKVASQGAKIISKTMGKQAAKFAAKAIGRFIPGVNIALLIWDGIEIGMFLYDYLNADPNERIKQILEAIKKMPPRVQTFMNTIINKYKSIPDLGDDLDKLEDFLYGLDVDSFNRLIQKVQDTNINFKKLGGSEKGAVSDAFLKKMLNWSEPDYELSQEEQIDDVFAALPMKSQFVQNKEIDLILPTTYAVGDVLASTMLVDVQDVDEKFLARIKLTENTPKYKVLSIKKKHLAVEMTVQDHVFEVHIHKDLHLFKTGIQYWDIERNLWVSKEAYDSAK